MMEAKQPTTALEWMTSHTLTALLAPLDMRARYVATERFTLIVAQSLGPLVAATIMDHFDPRWVWYGCSVVCAISIFGFYGLHLHSRERLEERGNNSVDDKKGAEDAI